MKGKKFAITLLLCTAWALTAGAQNTVESIRKMYQGIHERIRQITPNEEGETAYPPVYYDLNIVQNLPGTGPHHENIRMLYDEVETAEDLVYPPHYLNFVTAKYNFAARQFYEEYLYDDKGQVMFIYAITPDVGDDITPYELRLWFDGNRLLRFTAKKAEDNWGESENLSGIRFSEEYLGTTIPQKYRQETDRCRERSQRFLEVFKSIDENTYL